MAEKQRILIVDDDENIAELISLYLMRECYETKIVGDGESALADFDEFKPNLILLDLMLPGLELGAEDYMIKPFDSKELIARVKAVIRRYNSSTITLPELHSGGEYVEYPDLIVNMTNYAVTYLGKNIEMPPKELELLYFLSSHPNQVFTREQLLDNIWGYEYIGDTRTVDVHIKRLREKIHDNQFWAISTVWGIGYKFEVKK